MDAEQMDMASDSVDGVLCRWGYMLMADPKAAVGETRRVLRAGGRLSFAVWGPPERNAWGVVVNSLLVERGLVPAPEPGAPGLFALSDDAVLRSHLDGAGFTPLTIESVPIRWRYEDFDEYWGVLTRGSMVMRRAMAPLSDEEMAGLYAACDGLAAPYRGEGFGLFPDIGPTAPRVLDEQVQVRALAVAELAEAFSETR